MTVSSRKGERAPSSVASSSQIMLDPVTAAELSRFNQYVALQEDADRRERALKKAEGEKEKAAAVVRELEGNPKASKEQKAEAEQAYKDSLANLAAVKEGKLPEPGSSTPTGGDADGSESPTADAGTATDAETAETPAPEDEAPTEADSETEAAAATDAPAEPEVAEASPEPPAPAEPEVAEASPEPPASAEPAASAAAPNAEGPATDTPPDSATSRDAAGFAPPASAGDDDTPPAAGSAATPEGGA